MSDTIQDRIDLKLLYPFIQSTIDTLRLQYSFLARPGKPRVKNEEEEELRKDIVVVAGLMGGDLVGTIAMCFTKNVFVQVMECMHDEKYANADEETLEQLMAGGSEMLGIIIWEAKRALSEKGIELEKTVPTTIQGHDLKVNYRSTAPTVILPFSTSVGPFNLEVTAEVNTESGELEEDEDAA